MTYRDLLREGVEKLRDRSPTGTLDAGLLLRHLKGWSREQLYLNWPEPAETGVVDEFHRLLELRATGYPLAYITGHKEFMGLDFQVDPRVLIPRPDTEVLVEEALRLLGEDLKPLSAPKILDLCTGSGCVGIAVSHFSQHPVVLADLSPQALEVAQDNAQKILGHPLPAHHSNLFEGVPGTWDLILSNPPYLTPRETEASLAQGWKEPSMALDGGGQDGLKLIQELLGQAQERLRAGGWILLEAAPHQDEALELLIQETGFKLHPTLQDLSGKKRVYRGQKWTKPL